MCCECCLFERAQLAILNVSQRRCVRFRKEVLAHLGIQPGDEVALYLLEDGLALARAAQTASVSLATVLHAQVLAQAMISGELPSDYAAHIGTLLDEAPLPVIVAAVEAAAVQGGVSAAKVWKHIGVWARLMRSPRKEWYGFRC
jgi:hypothetical protein